MAENVTQLLEDGEIEVRISVGRSKTPARKTPGKFKQPPKDPVKVFCRLRPLQNDGDISCLVATDTTITLVPPESCLQYRANNYKEYQYVFKQVFSESSQQKEVFDMVALPLVDDLIQGKNGLLFTYGVTGSGKTYTMTGEPNDGGILPRCLDVLFNSISDYQAKKFVFKPDKMNGFEVLSEVEAMLERQRELHGDLATGKNTKTPRRKNSDEEIGFRIPDTTKITQLNDDNTFGVFVTYVEIYNNGIYDLLEDISDDILRNKSLQVKLVREDASRNMYVHGVTEVEVKSTNEAFQAFYKGQKRKRMAHTALNAESSRSHSVFTVRLVQAPLDCRGEAVVQDKRAICISQLSLVDLAGSERTNRTKNTGQRLREASNINNSLLTLRLCLETLRENQLQGTEKMVPYRESKMTHLFKNYFDGDGQVEMIVCVNPSVDDFDENVHVLKFAEMTQEVQVSRPVPLRVDLGLDLPKGRRNAYKNLEDLRKEIENEIVEPNMNQPIYSLSGPFPCLELLNPNDNTIMDLTHFLELRIQRRQTIQEEIKKLEEEHIKRLMEADRDLVLLKQENSLVKQELISTNLSLENEQRKNVILENRLVEKDNLVACLQRQMNEQEKLLRSQELELREKNIKIKQKAVEKEYVKQRCNDKIAAEKEKLSKEMETRVKEHQEQLQSQLRKDNEKLRVVKRILSDENSAYILPNATSSCPSNARPELSQLQPGAGVEHNVVPSQFLTPHVRKHGIMTRHRRSRSAGNSKDMWLDHRPGIPASLPTVMQPQMKKRKSITKLTDAKDVTGSKASKYCLMTQEQDSAGELETRLYKAKAIVEHYSRSPSTRKRLHTVMEEMVLPVLELIQFVDTRWSSEYNMLSRLHAVRKAVGAELANSENNIEILTEVEWKQAAGIVEVLGPLADATKEISGDNKALKSRFSFYDSDPIFCPSMLCDPRFRGVLIDDMVAVNTLAIEVKKLSDKSSLEPNVKDEHPSCSSSSSGLWSSFDSIPNTTQPAIDNNSEVKDYLNEPRLANTLVVLSSTAEDREIEVRISWKKYLFKKMRPYYSDKSKNLLCPKPAEANLVLEDTEGDNEDIDAREPLVLGKEVKRLPKHHHQPGVDSGERGVKGQGPPKIA
uniref:(California timema) hypothetical protein n=1 Tax=Timema californicum TaxID=61474 RepID=A0A7R9IW58_TIMCA|nr:unnamed protein product [Timema californicum]